MLVRLSLFNVLERGRNFYVFHLHINTSLKMFVSSEINVYIILIINNMNNNYYGAARSVWNILTTAGS